MLDEDDRGRLIQRIRRELVTRRKALRLTQQDLAQKLGYHRSVIAHAEQGRIEQGGAFWGAVDEFFGTGVHFRNLYYGIHPPKKQKRGSEAFFKCPECHSPLSIVLVEDRTSGP